MWINMRCINCRLCIRRIQKHLVSSLTEHQQKTLSRWLLSELPPDAVLCNACLLLLNTAGAEHERLFGHTMVCLNCGRSLHPNKTCGTKKRYKNIDIESPLLTDFVEQNADYVPSTDNYVCYSCWLRKIRATKNSSPNIKKSVEDTKDSALSNIPEVSLSDCPEPAITSPPPSPNIQRESPINVISLANYRRAPNTSRRCIFHSCERKVSHVIPKYIKTLMLLEHNFYVPIHSRVCKIHLNSDKWEWHVLPQMYEKLSEFRADHIEDMMNLLK